MTADRNEPEQSIAQRVMEIDASALPTRELQSQLSQLDEGCRVRLSGLPLSLSGVGAGINRSIDLQIVGSIGPYAFMLGRRVRGEIACGHSFHSGGLLVRGDCGPHVACYSVGGLVTVHGKADAYAAYGLSGGEVVIRGRCGLAAGCRLRVWGS